jgi:hypothetical protein
VTLPLFAAAVGSAAALLFLVQPLFARLLLPHLGSSPVVWNTALVCYQAGLLAGYAYANLSASHLPLRWQAVLHLTLLLGAGAALPLTLRHTLGEPSVQHPAAWLAGTLAVSIGAPYVAVAGSSPLLQSWLAASGRRGSADPYLLYAVSNTGSIAALLAYPFLVEPALGLATQAQLWTWGYAVLVLLSGACALAVWRRPGAAPPAVPEAAAGGPSETWPQRGRWMLLAALPSALLVSVTQHISTDVAAVPLLWVLPLVLYLLTYVLAFGGGATRLVAWATVALPLVVVPLAVALGARITQPVVPLILLHLGALFVLAALCHGRLAASRPHPSRLTAFYLWISLGGVLGGAFSALLAPLLFDAVSEYPLALVLATLAAYRPGGVSLLSSRPADRSGPGGIDARGLDVALPLLLGLLGAGLFWRGRDATLTGNPLAAALLFGPLVLICLGFRRRPLRFGLGAGALLLASALFYGGREGALLEQRSAFGVHRVRQVTLDPGSTYHVLVHGNTVHGVQRRDAGHMQAPQAYYVPSGPVGQVFTTLGLGAGTRPVGVVGVGAGGLACYGGPGQPWHFFEIDPLVAEIARDPRYFTFLRDCPPHSEVVLGDGRLTLGRVPDAHFGAIVLDAYSSDAIPVHLLTREALSLYLRKLAPGGVLVFHLSSRHLDLAPVLGGLAAGAGLEGRVRTDAVAPEAGAATPSRWAVLARHAADLGALPDDPRWERLPAPGAAGLWTDDYASIFAVFRWL